jgi:acyl carrier protein
MKGQQTRNEIVKTVIDSVGVVMPDLVSVNADTHLVGPDAVLDSVGFVTLLIALEENLADAVDLSASFLELNDIGEAGDPFSTVGSLADHIIGLLSKR